MPKIKGWIVEGKYTEGPGSEWETLEEVGPNDPEGAEPGDPTGRDYASWLCREYTISAPYAQHRVRPATFEC